MVLWQALWQTWKSTWITPRVSCAIRNLSSRKGSAPYGCTYIVFVAVELENQRATLTKEMADVELQEQEKQLDQSTGYIDRYSLDFYTCARV